MDQDVLLVEEGTPLSLPELELHVLAACLANTDILEFVSVRYTDRFSPQNESLFRAVVGYFNK